MTVDLAGKLLVATPLILDPNFLHTVVYVYAHAVSDGAAGVVVNRPTQEPTIDHLPEWRSVLAAPPSIFWGGPVAEDGGVVLMVEDGEVAVSADRLPPDRPVRARLFVGQAGWGPGQLEAEVAEGSWLVMDPTPEDVLPTFPDRSWGALLRRRGGEAAVWATHTPDPTLN